MNAIEYIRNLEAVGFTRAQAEVQAQGLTEIMETKFATKDDLRNEVLKIQTEFKLVRSEMREMESRLTIKLGSIMVAGIAFMSLLEHLYK